MVEAEPRFGVPSRETGNQEWNYDQPFPGNGREPHGFIQEVRGLAGMTIAKFAKQIDHLLWTGAIRGDQILSLHHLLKDYERGEMTDEEMQDAIDQCDPEQIDKLLDEQFPHLFE